MTHFIRQQYLHVDLKGSESDGFALQNQLTDLYYTRLIPAMEQVLDQLSPSGSHLVIDKLEIDAGTIPLNRIDDDLAIAVAEALKLCIVSESAKTGSRQNARDQQGSYIQSDHEILWDVFTYFLSHGSLPWSYKLPAGINLEELLSWNLTSYQSEVRGMVPVAKIREVLQSQNAVNRLTLQFSDGFIQRLLAQVSPDLLQPVNELNILLLKADKTALTSEIRQFLKKLILQKGVIQITSNTKVSKVRIIEQMLIELKSKPDLEQMVFEIFNHLFPEIELQKVDLQKHKLLIGEDTIYKNHSEDIRRRDVKIQDEESKQGIFIDNAGLVLLHPFLPRLFDELKIAEDDKLLLPERALNLLHYLVTGNTESPEYELALPKILCGIPLSEPVALTEGPGESDISEASDLLDAVVSHWEVLGNTTRDGLRGNFLVRPGKLSQKDDGDWLLQVESRSFDFLLNQLPWGISMIKLPWMKNMLWVEWR